MNASANILTGAEAPGLFTAMGVVATSACASAVVIWARVRAVNIAMVMEAASMTKSKRAPLPPPCRREGCVFGWIDSPDRGGYQRCECPRGLALAQGAKYGKKQPAKHDGRMAGAGK